MKKQDNLELWNAVEMTNPHKTKKAKIGALTLTAINATSQIKTATFHWGMYGTTWGLKNINYEYMDIDKTRLAIVRAMFYYPTGEFELSTSIKVYYMTRGEGGYLKIDDDFMKKAETDLTTKALSKLGFNADVFMGLYDDNKYLAEVKEKFKDESPVKKQPQQNATQAPQVNGPKKTDNKIPKPKRLTKVTLEKMKTSEDVELLTKALTYYALSTAQKFVIESRIKELKKVVKPKKKMTKTIHSEILKSTDIKKIEQSLIDYEMSVNASNKIKGHLINLKKQNDGKK